MCNERDFYIDIIKLMLPSCLVSLFVLVAAKYIGAAILLVNAGVIDRQAYTRMLNYIPIGLNIVIYALVSVIVLMICTFIYYKKAKCNTQDNI